MSTSYLVELSPSCTASQPGIFSGRRGLLERGHFDKHFIDETPMEGSARKKIGVFLLDTFKKTEFQMRHNQGIFC